MKRNSSREGKVRINVWLERQTLSILRAEGRLRGVPLQALIESAVSTMYGPGLQEKRDKVVLGRLNLVDRRVQVVERLIEVVTEGFVVFLRIWLGTMPQVPDEEVARDRCERRYQNFLKVLGVRLAEGLSFFGDLPEGTVFEVGGETKQETFSNFVRTRSDLAGGGSYENKKKS